MTASSSARIVASACFAIASAAASPAFADDARLPEARRHHQALDFEKCVDALRAAPPAESTTAERADAEVLAGVCNYELGRSAAADEHFKKGLRLDARVLLPPYSSPKMVEAFAIASNAVKSEQPAQPQSQAQQPPPTPPPSTETKRSSPPPVAAFVLGGAAIVAGSVGAYGFIHGRDLESRANRARFESDAYDLGDRARGAMTLTNVCLASAVVFAGAAVVVWISSR